MVAKELRNVVVEELKELMAKDPQIIALDADLSAASNWNQFEQDFPEQFVNVGIAEANMIGMASGLSIAGAKPFVHTFAPFATRRVFDQLFLSGGYAQTSLAIYGSDPGFTVGPNGGTHTSFEDIALVRMIPNAVICDAADETQMRFIIRSFAEMKGIRYVRGNRKAVPDVYSEDTTFEIGKGILLKSGSDGLLLVSGQLVSTVLEVAHRFEAEGLHFAVIDMFTLKPFDRTLFLEQIGAKKLIVTIENHNRNGGLGSIVSEILAEEAVQVPLMRIGIDEEFGQVGTPEFLQDYFGLSTEKLYEQILKSYQMKQKNPSI